MRDKKPKKLRRTKRKYNSWDVPGKTIVQQIDDALMAIETVSFNGQPRSITCLAAIAHQLSAKIGAGNKTAGRVLYRYDEYARQNKFQKVQIMVVSEKDRRIIGPIEMYKKGDQDE